MFVLRVGSTHRSAFASPTGPGSMQLPARSHQEQMTSASPVGRYCRKFRPCFREELFFDLALEDLTPVGDLFRPIFERPCGVNGGISLEVSPPLAHDTTRRLATAKALDDRAARPNLFIKIPPDLGRIAGHRGGHLRGAAALARAICFGCRGLVARHRALIGGRIVKR